jgi:hypothetical protein
VTATVSPFASVPLATTFLSGRLHKFRRIYADMLVNGDSTVHGRDRLSLVVTSLTMRPLFFPCSPFMFITPITTLNNSKHRTTDASWT